MRELSSLNYKEVQMEIVEFLKFKFKQNGFKKAVIGLSGGLDSAVVANLAVLALGKDNVHGILMPYNKVEGSATMDVKDATIIAEHLQISYETIDITKPVDMLCDMYGIDINDDTMGYDDALQRGNISARLRMVTLFQHSSKHKALVLGTECKSEELLGYFTVFADSASSIESIIDLYKTEVFALAKYLELPQFILTKSPSARLWNGHTDEKELGLPYSKIDKVLVAYSEAVEYYCPDEFYEVTVNVKKNVICKDITDNEIDAVLAQVRAKSFKHHLPIVPDFSFDR